MRKLARISITLGWIVLLTGGNAVWAVEASGPVQLDQRVQLFIDDFLIERTERVWRTLNRSRKVPENPIIKPDRPWEGYLVLQPGSVIYDPNKRQFQMWYNTLATESDSDIEQFLCYATSQDGIRWEKPELGLVDFRGSKANNIVLRWCNWDHSVIRDPEDPDPNRLYKMVYWQTHDRDRCGICRRCPEGPSPFVAPSFYFVVFRGRSAPLRPVGALSGILCRPPNRRS